MALLLTCASIVAGCGPVRGKAPWTANGRPVARLAMPLDEDPPFGRRSIDPMAYPRVERRDVKT